MTVRARPHYAKIHYAFKRHWAGFLAVINWCSSFEDNETVPIRTSREAVLYTRGGGSTVQSGSLCTYKSDLQVTLKKV